MRQLIALLLLAVTVALVPACSEAGEKTKGAGEKEKAPNFVLKAADGKTVELDKLKGKVVVVNFWATWCGPCKMEIPGFLDVYGKYKDKGLEIIGVSLDQQGWDVVRPYIAKANITYPVVVGDERIVSAYGSIDAIPATFIVDKSGRIVDHHVGYMSKQDFEEKVKGLL